MTTFASQTWSIPGADDESIVGETTFPVGDARATMIVVHGFKGYLDYGMFPALAAAGAAAGCVTHRFNFSHSGMTRDVATFARPDLFARDTWNRQVADLQAIDAALDDGTLAGGDLPRLALGHSRGGVSTLLFLGRHHPAFVGAITVAAPSSCCRDEAAVRAQFDADGHIVSPSARTGQTLRIERAWLDEQDADPEGHDLLRLAATIELPVLVIHGTDDPTVPASCAAEIASAVGHTAQSVLIDGANHVFNAPNPMPADAEPSEPLAQLLRHMTAFVDEVARPLR